MAIARSKPEVCNVPPVTVAGEHAAEANLERQGEFEEILSHSLPKFRRVAMRRLRNPEDAEDAVQDAMLSAFRHIDRFDGRAQMTTWLTAIVINAVRMQIRRRPRGQMISIDHSPEDHQPTLAETLADQRPTPEKTLEQCELRQLLTRLTAALPAKQQAALRLRQRDGLSVKEAAERLRVPEGTVKALLTRGRVKLMQRFQAATAGRKPNKASCENGWNDMQSIPLSFLGRDHIDA
jgi:RNA polymerase sigma-70 factor (ECF subfamily)